MTLDSVADSSGERGLGSDPRTNLAIIAKSGSFGPYLIELLPEEEGKKKKKEVKAKSASLLSTMTLDPVTLDDTLMLLSLPKKLGVNSETGDKILAQNERWGPYLKRGFHYRILLSEDIFFTNTFNDAHEKYKQPKVRCGCVTYPSLEDLGVAPETKRWTIIKDGRFGIYVTDGETNATLNRDDTVEVIKIERAQELLVGRRACELENGGAPKKKSSRKKKAPTLIKTTLRRSGAKRNSKHPAAKR